MRKSRNLFGEKFFRIQRILRMSFENKTHHILSNSLLLRLCDLNNVFWRNAAQHQLKKAFLETYGPKR